MKTTPVVDLRSDTFTKPSPAMLAAMVAAEVGDDVWGEDPTAQALEARAAALAGKEAAMFVVSGTMANSLAIRLQTEAGDEVLMHALSHPFHHEAGGAAALWGVTIRPLPGPRGLIDADALRRELRPDVRHMSRQRLLTLENTHNGGGGTVDPLDHVRQIASIAREAGLAVHLDGARLFNASVASGVPVAEFAAAVDTVSFCLSKGLGAPIGSMLCGPRVLIDKGRRFRHMLGGGWRQAGVLAAAGLFALDHNVARLADDHRRARALGDAIVSIGAGALVAPVESNLLFFVPAGGPGDAPRVVSQLAGHGVLVAESTPGVIRAVTHLDVDDEGIARTIAALRPL